MEKSIGLIKTKLNGWYSWLVDNTPEPIKDATTKIFRKAKNEILKLYKKPVPKPKLHEHAMKKAYKSYRLENDSFTDYVNYLNHVKDEVLKLIKDNLNEMGSVKVQLTLWLEFLDKNNEKFNVAFNTNMVEVFPESDLDQLYKNFIRKLKEQFENEAFKESGVVLNKVLHLDVNFHELNLTRGSSYIELPKWISDKKAVINPKNNDEECFKWSVIIALHQDELKNNPQRISKKHKEFAKKYDFSSLEFPLSIKDISTFERKNKNISINVLQVVGNEFSILKRAEFHKDNKVVNLLLISDGEKNHYTTVKDLSKLLGSKNSKNHNKKYFCINCLNGFTSEITRDDHFKYCINRDAVTVSMPKNKFIKYNSGQHQYKAPFAIYADFECILKPINEGNKINKHIPCGFCLYETFAYGESKDPLMLYRGQDCVKVFVDSIEQKVKAMFNKPRKSMEKLTKEQWTVFNNSKTCHICMKEFGDDKDKVRDHCHYTGLFRGAAHYKCNLLYKIPNFVPVFFHNLSGYDASLFIRQLGEKFNKEDIECIAQSKEKYISFGVKINVSIPTKDKEVTKKVTIRFLDSFRFMANSLDALSKNLSDNDCKNLRRYYDGDKFDLMRRKGVYPYEYMDSWGRFNETYLPDKDQFYNKLNISSISDADYDRAKCVWSKLGLRNMGQYHDEYLKTDVLLLADVFETFRDTCLDHYKLDPAYFYTAPGLAWQAALKKTGITLELLTDLDMLLMFENGIRGGITQVSKRYAKSNNKYMGELYNRNEKDCYVQYLDANNLYGWAMSQPLPVGNFQWIDPKGFDVLKNRDGGFILEVDLKYPQDLHDDHNDLPFLAEKKKPNKVMKLMPNLSDKKNYVVHIRTLVQALQHGLVLEKIHRIISFDQRDWLKEYIDFNTQLRTEAKNDFEKDFFKLMNNSVFGKTMENIRKHRDIKLVTNRKGFCKYVMKPNFKGSKRFSENLVGVEMGKTKIVMNKPVYLGQAILDLSKIVMYEFHYDYIKPKYGDKINLCYMDTDSFVYEIFTKDFYKDISDDVENRFDTSGYMDRPLPIGKNKKVIGKMKDELGGNIMTEFIALCPKVYAYKTIDDVLEKKCKGVKKCVVKKNLNFEDYREVLETDDIIRRSQLTFQSENHEMYTVYMEKIALTNKDDKRVFDGIDSRAIGHYRLT